MGTVIRSERARITLAQGRAFAMRWMIRTLLCIGVLTSSSAVFAEDAEQPAEQSTPVASSTAATLHEPEGKLDAVGASSLLLDMERIVAAQERAGWFAERQGQERIQGNVFETLCRATPAARRGALSLAQRRAQQLGDPRAVFEREGQELTSDVRAALRAERVALALKLGIEAATNDCPFWVKPRDGYLGIHTDRYRLTLNGESGGSVQLRRSEGRWTFGGGGGGRLLLGYGVATSLTVLAGIEFGGGAMLKPGEGETRFVVNYFPALPFVIRFRDLDWHYDVELTPVALFQSDNTRISYGGRFGLAIGTSALLTQGLIPWGGLAVAYEHYFGIDGRPAAHFIRGGLRIGVSWDP